MSDLVKFYRGMLVTVALFAASFALWFTVAWIRSAPGTLPAGSESAARLAPGPCDVGSVELVWVDPCRR